MGSVVGYTPRSSGSNVSVGSGSGGGDVEDILRRLGNVEGHVSELRSQVSAILAVIPHLATKADIADVRTEIGEFKAYVAKEFGALRADGTAMEAKIIKWIVATVLTSTTLAFTIAKFVH
jgi:hypothetical protein